MGAHSCLLLPEDRGAVCKGPGQLTCIQPSKKLGGFRRHLELLEEDLTKRRNFEPIASEAVVLLLSLCGEGRQKGPGMESEDWA